MISCYNDNMLSLKLDEEIEEKFRKTIGQIRGTHKGNLKTALEEAMMMWVNSKAAEAFTNSDVGEAMASAYESVDGTINKTKRKLKSKLKEEKQDNNESTKE